jgi:hypothetical protein
MPVRTRANTDRASGLVRLLRYWAVRELGESATSFAKRLGLIQWAVSISFKCGEKIARERKLEPNFMI